MRRRGDDGGCCAVVFGEDAQQDGRCAKKDEHAREVKEGDDIILLDEPLAGEKDFCLSAGDRAEEGESFLVAAQTDEKGGGERGGDNRGCEHGDKGDSPCFGLCEEMGREGSTDQNGEPRNDDDVERTREEKILSLGCGHPCQDSCQNSRQRPQSEQATEQEGSGNAEVLTQSSCAPSAEQGCQDEWRFSKILFEKMGFEDFLATRHPFTIQQWALRCMLQAKTRRQRHAGKDTQTKTQKSVCLATRAMCYALALALSTDRD